MYEYEPGYEPLHRCHRLRRFSLFDFVWDLLGSDGLLFGMSVIMFGAVVAIWYFTE